MWKAEIPLQGRPALNEFSSLNEGQQRVTSFLLWSFIPISSYLCFGPLILIVLYNCVMWTWCLLKCCPYPFIFTWCFEPLICLCTTQCCRRKRKNSWDWVVLNCGVNGGRYEIYMYILHKETLMLDVCLTYLTDYQHQPKALCNVNASLALCAECKTIPLWD